MIAWTAFRTNRPWRQEFFRQWMILNRREQYEPGSGMHRLWFSTGGSAGHSSLIGLDIFEGIFDPQGTQPRGWDVNVLKAQEVISSEQR
ncbi:MAG: hypothetical protein KDA80_10190, partial [Planctomycetaceae bacterium]|nr:hypothetical protein [Planctomycetaceae bacterium]